MDAHSTAAPEAAATGQNDLASTRRRRELCCVLGVEYHSTPHKEQSVDTTTYVNPK